MIGMDISDTIAPNSDQLDAVDLLSGPRTFTIERVSKGNAEQPVNLHLAEFPRPWRPGKSMRRVLISAWGADAATYVGRRVRLYCDPEVVFGGLAVGGTRIEALSHLDKPKKIPLLVSRGKSAMFTVKPLADDPPPSANKAQGNSKTAQTRTDEALTAFAGIGVKEQQLVDRIGRPADKWTAQDIASLEAVFVSIRDGKTTADEQFAAPAADEPPADFQGELYEGADQ